MAADKKTDKKGSKAATPDDIMAPAEMKSILALSKRGAPVSCAIALTTDKEGVILLDKKRKPKKLLAELKKTATDAGLTLDMPSMRFGRAVVDIDTNPSLLSLVVNKEAPGAMRPRLLEHVKKAGYKQLEIRVDAALETEPEDDQPAAPPQQAPSPRGDAAAAAPGTPPPSPPPAGPAPQATAAAPPPPAAPSGGPASPAPAPGQPGAADVGALMKELTVLVRQIVALASTNPQAAAEHKELASKAQSSLKSGDAAGGRKHIDELRNRLHGAATKPAAPQAPSQPHAPSPAIAKARLAWVATRQKVDGDLGKLHGAFSNAFKGHGRHGDVTKAFRTRVDTVLGTLDEGLAHKLDTLNNAKDPAEHAKLVQEAHGLIDGYRKHVATDKTIEALDTNPFFKVSIKQTMTASLDAIQRAIK
ncbi:MAG TPA: hypothetical protein VKI44_13310 [Acetobacteraceae bacterium]|nr:hypothetical protein [Acetobacteraceae bacterium]